MNFKIENKEKHLLIKVSVEKFDSTISPELKAIFVEESAKGVKNYIIDLNDVKYCDSSGLSALLVGNRLSSQVSGIFVLACLQPNVAKLIEISQLTSVLNLAPTYNEALDLLFMEELERSLGKEDFE
jgi:anti-sigma B factor antagonist